MPGFRVHPSTVLTERLLRAARSSGLGCRLAAFRAARDPPPLAAAPGTKRLTPLQRAGTAALPGLISQLGRGRRGEEGREESRGKLFSGAPDVGRAARRELLLPRKLIIFNPGRRKEGGEGEGLREKRRGEEKRRGRRLGRGGQRRGVGREDGPLRREAAGGSGWGRLGLPPSPPSPALLGPAAALPPQSQLRAARSASPPRARLSGTWRTEGKTRQPRPCPPRALLPTDSTPTCPCPRPCREPWGGGQGVLPRASVGGILGEGGGTWGSLSPTSG